ncbi:HTH-type transcriptional repressor PurR [Streptomyces alboniger]
MGAGGQPYVPVAEGAFTLDSGARAMHRLLREHPDIDGVFAANDLMAQGVCQVLREQGRRIPHDVAVVGFDDSSVAVTCRPRLTTVRQPVEEMGEQMARLLQERAQGTRPEPTSAIFDPELVVRESGLGGRAGAARGFVAAPGPWFPSGARPGRVGSAHRPVLHRRPPRRERRGCRRLDAAAAAGEERRQGERRRAQGHRVGAQRAEPTSVRLAG